MIYWAVALFICIPGIVLAAHWRYPGNIITPFFLPRLLSHREYPKSVFRQAGTGCLVFSLWLSTAVFAVPAVLPERWIDDNLWFMGIFAFGLPIIAAMSLLIGFYYLGVGIFARSKAVTPALQSIFAADTNRLDLYVKKLRKYTIINITALALLILLVAIEAALKAEPEGTVVLVNVALLITFIMTSWRVRDYLTKATIAMEQSGQHALASTLGSPLAMFFMWYRSYVLIKAYNLLLRRTQPANRSDLSEPHHSGKSL